jgi:hypothetical protein
MGSPMQDAINRMRGMSATDVADAEREPESRPGGKALDRLLMFLEERGYIEVAEGTMEAAVGEESIAAVRARVQQSSAAPTEGGGRASGDERRRRYRATARERRERRGEREGPGREQPAPTALVEAAAHIAEASMTAALAPTGPPTATGPQWRSLGPWTIPNGQTYGSSRVNVSGRLSATRRTTAVHSDRSGTHCDGGIGHTRPIRRRCTRGRAPDADGVDRRASRR